MARRGAAEVERRDDDPRSRPRRREEPRTPPPGGRWEPEVWQEEVRQPAEGPVRRTARNANAPAPKEFLPPEKPRSTKRPPKLPAPVADELAAAAGARRAPRIAERLASATRAYERDRYPDARRILKELADEAPASASVRELFGLTLYRMGRWREAIKNFEAFHQLTGSYDQHPAMADSYRALGRHREVDRVWRELAEASPSADLVTEGRIVAAGSRADRGDLAGAISMLEGPARRVTRPKEHHLRLWYALADLYERAGEVPAARDMFGRILRNDRSFFDSAERLAALG